MEDMKTIWLDGATLSALDLNDLIGVGGQATTYLHGKGVVLAHAYCIIDCVDKTPEDLAHRITGFSENTDDFGGQLIICNV